MAYFIVWKTGNGGIKYDEELVEYSDSFSEDDVVLEYELNVPEQPGGYRGLSCKRLKSIKEAPEKLVRQLINDKEQYIAYIERTYVGLSKYRNELEALKKAVDK